MNRIISEALEAGIVIAKAYREVAEHFKHPVAGDAQDGIDAMEKALEALQPPSGQVGEVVDVKAWKEVDRLCTALNYIKGIVERGIGHPLEPDVEIGSAVLNYVKELEALRQPVETVNEWNALTKEEMWDEIQAIRKLTDNDGTMSPRHSVANLVEELDALRTQPQAPVVEVSKAVELLQSALACDMGEGVFNRVTEALALLQSRKEPLVEVSSNLRSRLKDCLTGVCADGTFKGIGQSLDELEKLFHALLQSRKEPVVEVPGVEEILLAIGDDPDHPLKSAIRVHALLQSKGGRK